MLHVHKRGATQSAGRWVSPTWGDPATPFPQQLFLQEGPGFSLASARPRNPPPPFPPKQGTAPGTPPAEALDTGLRSPAEEPADAACQLPLQHHRHTAQPARDIPAPLGTPRLPARRPARGRGPRRVPTLGSGAGVARLSPREGQERSLSPPTLGTRPHTEQGACSPVLRLLGAGGTWGCFGDALGTSPPAPNLGDAGLWLPAPTNARSPRVRGEPTSWEQREERRERKKKKKVGPVSQLWPFVPRAFGPSSKGIGFAEANDDTSTSSGAGSACCWRRATRVKKYCGHLIIDSLFLHYGRAQRPQLRLRPLCTHHTHTHKGRQSLPRPGPAEDGQHRRSWVPSTLQSPGMHRGRVLPLHFPTPHRDVTTSPGKMAPWL